MTIRIVGATLRDLSYVASNMRPDDRAEIGCQFDEWNPALLAAMSLRDHAYVALINGNPEAAFGAARTGHSRLWTAWSWMTPKGWRAVPRITEFVRAEMIPDIYAQGGQRVEARALAANTSARRWLLKMGATEQGTLRNYGRAGEEFILFEWCRCDFEQQTVSEA